MGALKLTACMKVVAKMGDMDQESLLERLDRYTADGVPKDRAQVMAAADTLAELIDERREFMAMLREQHPDLFRVTNAIPEDQDVDPDAPDIKRSAARDITDTPEFKRWFGDSKVVDADGRPLVVYHGTEKDFTVADPGRNKDDFGFFTTPNPRAAESYAFNGPNKSGQVMPLYLSIKNPYVMDNDERLMLQLSPTDFYEGGMQEFIESIKKDGYDGIKIEAANPAGDPDPENEEFFDVWVALYPEQIKSAIGNNGQFDPENADITRSPARSPSEIFGRDIAPVAIKAYKSLSPRAKGIIDGWNVNWSIGQGKLRDSDAFAEVMTAYEPVREKLRQVYGETIPAYRGEQRKGEESEGDRFLFSWTPMREIATGFAVNRRGGIPPEIPQSKVDEQIEAYRKTGIARLNGYKFVRQDPKGWEPDGPDYYHIYWRGEMQTDGDDIAQALQSEKAERDEYIAALREKGTLYTADIPVDSVAFIPVGVNLTQPEFVAEYNPRKDEAQEVKFSPARNDMGFYSALAKGVEDMQTKQAPAGAWKTQIKGLVNKGQVKQDEIEWSGIEDFLDLQQGKVSKDQILEYLRGNGVQVEEVVLGSGGLSDSEVKELDDLNRRYAASERGEDVPFDASDFDRMQELEQNGEREGLVKYTKYTLPGGENYREVLLTLPEKAATSTARYIDIKKDGDVYRVSDASGLLKSFRTADEAMRYRSELHREDQNKAANAGQTYRSNHWDQPNVLAHVRVNDRTDAGGKRVLFVEELQSDWGQDGKKKGVVKSYRPDEVQPISAIEAGKMTSADEELFWHFKTPDNVFSIPKSKYADRDAAREYIIREKKINSGGVPDAPFIGKTDGWLNLALKRVIAMAVDGGYDAVAFVNGDQSADRYDLSKQVDSITYEPTAKGYNINVLAGGRNIKQGNYTVAELEDIVGKEIVQKMEAREGRQEFDPAVEPDLADTRVLEGVDLKVGGEGMKAFYDKIVPNALKALLKKVGGGQMETVTFNSRFDLVEHSGGWVITDTKNNSYYRGPNASRPWVEDIASAKIYLSENSAESAAQLLDGQDDGVGVQPGFTITDAMREKVSTEGLPLFSPARDMTDTPEFKAWFGDSKVVDDEGRPKVVYHGTTANFSSFGKTKDIGFHFGTQGQANSIFGKKRNGRQIIPAYLSIKNPLRLTDDPRSWPADYVITSSIPSGTLTGDEIDGLLSAHRQRVVDARNEYRSGPETDSRWETIYDKANTESLSELRALLESKGFDGLVYQNQYERAKKEDSWVAFRPEQIKSAIGNRGTFDPSDADITRSPGRTASGAAWDSPSASKWDDAVYKMQDKQVDLKRVTDAIQEAGGAIADDLNVYLQEELYHGRAAKRTEDFVNLELNPLVEQLAKDGLELSDLEEFLHARHAPEANAVIAQRNPGVPGLQDGGSGMKTADAMNYMAGLPADLRQKLETAAAKVDDILKKTRELYVDYELESRDTVDAWGKMFQHYIPLMREDKDGNGSPGLGQGFSVKGRETKGRTGSTRKVVDILANIALQRERAIVRGEKNRVSQALVGLASSNPNEGFWIVDEVPTERVFNEKTGLVEDRMDPLYKSRPNAIIAKIKGPDGKVKEHAVLFNEEDERAMRMAAALKNLDADKLEGLMGVSAMISRYFAASVTQWNPLFGPVNMIRDVQAVALNLSSTPIKGEERKVLRNVMPALAGVYKDLRAARKGKTTNTQWAKLWEEFQDVGGQTGYRDLFRNSEERANAIKKVLDPDAWADTKLGRIFTAGGALKVPLAQARRAAAWIFDLLSDYNDALENGVRLAVYKAGLDRGLSKEQAASIAKNASTNFNRKGQIGQQAGALYAFFNAAVQGTARIGDTLFDMEPGKPKTMRLSSAGKKIVGGGVLLGAIQALMLAAAGYDDEDPPQFARERSLIIPIGDKKYVSIPMPLGFNVIPNIGRIATEFALGGFKDPHERAVQLISLFSETFNPIGSAGLSMQTLAPTALDPLVALTENKDWTGKPIARESSNPAIPGHALAKDTATTWSKAISEGINTLSGGNKYVAGVFSPTPDQIDYLLGWATGGVGREISKLDQTVTAAVYGEELPPYKIPLVGRFYGNARSQASEGSAFYANTQDLNKLETEIKGLEKDGKRAEANELRRSRSEAYLITAANQAERQVQRLRQQKRELIKNDAPREQVQAVEAQITTVMARLNRAMEALEEKQK